MLQSHQNRVEALKSVLPLLELHLDLITRVRSALGDAWESEPSPLDKPPKPSAPTPDESCQVQCATCEDRLHCRDEAWIRREMIFRAAYRLDVVTQTIERLAGISQWGALLARALYWTYIEDWTSWNPANRLRWAGEALDFLAEEVPGDIYPFQVGDRQTGILSRQQQIVRLREAGLSYHAIAQTLRCSKTTISALLHGKRVRHGRTMDATGA